MADEADMRMGRRQIGYCPLLGRSMGDNAGLVIREYPLAGVWSLLSQSISHRYPLSLSPCIYIYSIEDTFGVTLYSHLHFMSVHINTYIYITHRCFKSMCVYIYTYIHTYVDMYVHAQACMSCNPTQHNPLSIPFTTPSQPVRSHPIPSHPSKYPSYYLAQLYVYRHIHIHVYIYICMYVDTLCYPHIIDLDQHNQLYR